MKLIRESVFETTEEYNHVRIPGIVCTENGTLIAYCELRSGGDWSVIDIGMRKSFDQGKTWSERKILVSSDGKDTINNPVMISDGKTLHFLYCKNYHNVYYMKSEDEGETFSNLREITDKIRESLGGMFFSCIATGPCHGIKASFGRLLVPVWFAQNKNDDKAHHPSVISVLYSDDKGKSWKVGNVLESLKNASESCIAEFNGKVILNIRHEGRRHRAFSQSTDGVNWSKPVLNKSLVDPICCAGFCKADNSLLFTNCASHFSRSKLTLKRLDENCKCEEKLLINKYGGYSDIAFYGGNAYVLYESKDNLLCATVEI